MKSHLSVTPPVTRRRPRDTTPFSDKYSSPFLSSRLNKSLSTTRPVPVEKITTRFSSKAIPTHESKPSYEEVLKLDYWKTSEDEECRYELVEIERAFKLKQSQQDDVERELHDRRIKGKLPNVVPRSTNEIQERITGKRIETRKHDLTFRDKSRYAKMYEDELERTRQKYEAELEERTFEREQVRILMNKVRKLMIDVSLDINREKEQALQQEESVKRAKEAKELTQAEYFFRKTSMQQALEKRLKEFEERTAAISNQLDGYSNELVGIDRRVHEIKENIKLVQRTQILHFYSLLKEGQDTRNEGLEWIVKALWSFNCTVKPSRFPVFLDYTSISIILELAGLSLEYNRLQKAMAYEIAHSNLGPPNKDRLNGVKMRLKSIRSNLKAQKQIVKYDQVTRKSNLVWQNETTSSAPSRIDKDLSSTLSLEKQLIELRRKINDLKNNEIDRLTHACFMGNYEKKQNIEMKTVLSCIVGVECIDRYLANINREQKALKSQLLQSKTFKFSKSN